MTDRREDCAAGIGRDARADLLAGYERISVESRRLMVAVTQGDWDEVARTETACRDLIAQIRQLACTNALDAAQNRRRIELLGRILADDARIRESLEPWLLELEQYLGQPRGSAAR